MTRGYKGRMLCLSFLLCFSHVHAQTPRFERVQPEIFGAPETLTNAWADFDNDGDLDLFVGFRNGHPNRLYRNEDGRFTDVAREMGVADDENTRGAAWGDYNGDGGIDLYVAFGPPSTISNKLYRNNGKGQPFTDVAREVGVDVVRNGRQITWVDFDNDGDVDLFLAVRNGPNLLFRNENGKLSDVSSLMSIDDPRRTVGAVWFDFDEDGDLDLYVTNQNGDRNGLFRNDGERFVDVAPEHGVDKAGRPLRYENGGIRPCLADYENDGDLDILVINYGPNALLRNDRNGRFIDVASEVGLAIDSFYDSGTWGDFDHDGRLDIYINGTVTGGESFRDYLFHSEGSRFNEVTPENIGMEQADHGAHWVDFDGDGDLDLSLTGATPEGMHTLFRNMLPDKDARRSLQVMVLDANGHYTRAGTEIRLYAAGGDRLLGTAILDTGSGYNSQNAMPVHFGLAQKGPVDVEITSMSQGGRSVARLSNIDPSSHAGGALIAKVDRNGRIVP